MNSKKCELQQYLNLEVSEKPVRQLRHSFPTKSSGEGLRHWTGIRILLPACYCESLSMDFCLDFGKNEGVM